MVDLTDRDEEALYQRVAQIVEAARHQVSRTVNTAMVHAYWLIGQEIVEGEQHGKERAGYGEELVKRLAARLTQRFGKGFTASNIKRMRQFYLAFPQGSRIPEELGGPPKDAAVRRLFTGVDKQADQLGQLKRRILAITVQHCDDRARRAQHTTMDRGALTANMGMRHDNEALFFGLQRTQNFLRAICGGVIDKNDLVQRIRGTRFQYLSNQCADVVRLVMYGDHD
jgi:hypothetical protein